MTAPLAEGVSALLLALVLAAAVVRPWGWPEAAVAVPAAALLVGVGAIDPGHAREEAARLGPVVGFLAAVLVLARLCSDEGVFAACGRWMARASRGRPRRLLAAVFLLASVITAVLSLDATVVLLTPVVLATAARTGVRPRPHVYACAHLANSASLLLPVSNLTNLLAFAASGLTFTRFAALMALPWLVAIGVEYAVFRREFATDLRAPADAAPVTAAETPPEGAPPAAGGPPDDGERRPPLVPLTVVAATLAGFAVASALGADPVWAAAAGAAVLAVRALARRRTSPAALLRAASLPFLAFVLALGIVVRAVVDHGLAAGLGHLVPGGASLPALLGTAALAAALAAAINNLPAVLALLPLAAPAGPGPVLAVLIGVNIGPNLTYTGSLATLLWRRVVRDHGADTDLREFTRLGLLTAPAALVLAVLALGGALHVLA